MKIKVEKQKGSETFGLDRYIPVCSLAVLFTLLTKRKYLSPADLVTIRALGFEVEIV